MGASYNSLTDENRKTFQCRPIPLRAKRARRWPRDECSVLLVTIPSAFEINSITRPGTLRSAITLKPCFNFFDSGSEPCIASLALAAACCWKTSPSANNSRLKRKHPKPKLGPLDKLFWVVVRGFWSQWKDALVFVLPETVVRWHRTGFKLYWTSARRTRTVSGHGRTIL